MADERPGGANTEREALASILTQELSKLRLLSTQPELLGLGELKSLEVYARIVKLLERGPRTEEQQEESWSAERIGEVLEGRGSGL